MEIFSIKFVDSPGVMIFLLVQVLIAITNAILMKRLGRFPKAKRNPKVSILVPARNEAETIGKCIDSLLEQDYPNLEIIVLSDNSTDRTEAILNNLKSERLRVINGKPLPDAWIGKSWACQQLANEANSELILFTDADTTFQPKTIGYAVDALEKGNIDLLTATIRNDTITLGEKITVPFPTWSIFSILPLFIAYLLPRSTAFSAANGKFMFFRKEVYERIGGHTAIRNNAVEDIELGKLVKKNGYRWRLLDASNLISCRMYHSLAESIQGFTKNYFALFGYKLFVALFVWIWLGIITWHPIVTILSHILTGNFLSGFWYPLVSILATGFLWLLTSLKFNFPIHLFLLYPLIITVSGYIGLRSIFLTLTGQTVWKGRKIARRKIRLI